MSSDLTTIEESVKVLGKTKEVKRFLLAVLLVSRFHLTSRPISKANDLFYKRISKYCDELLQVLLLPGWPCLLPEIEDGLKVMRLVSDWANDKNELKKAGNVFKEEFYKYFSSINVSWSHLTPSDDLNINRWPNPKHILIAFGPNIGIGDELIFFRAVRRISKHYPLCKIEVVSYSPSLWDDCTYISKVSYPVENQLSPFIKAKEVLEEDENNFVVFVEFATAPIYRNLEIVSSFKRFIYLDTGSKVARIVDQERAEIFEYNMPLYFRVYETLSKALDAIGLKGEYSDNGWEPPILDVSKTTEQTRKKIFINPFSSKDYRALSTDWWADILIHISSNGAVDVNIFAGINKECRSYSSQIVEKLKTFNCDVSLHGDETVPTILSTIKSAMASDLVIGLDTFTAHINVIQATPCISIFFGSKWHAWYAPDPNVFNASIYDSPEHLGRLATRILNPFKNEIVKEVDHFFLQLKKVITLIKSGEIPDNLFSVFQNGENVINKLNTEDPEFLKILTRSFQYYANSLKQVMYRTPGEYPNGKQFAALLKRVADELWDSNFYRYLGYLTNQKF